MPLEEWVLFLGVLFLLVVYHIFVWSLVKALFGSLYGPKRTNTHE